MTTPAENAATAAELAERLRIALAWVPPRYQLQAREDVTALLAEAEEGAEWHKIADDNLDRVRTGDLRNDALQADRDDAVRAAAEHRIEADHAHDDYEDAEAVIRQIAEKRPNQPFDPWAVELCQAFLDRPAPDRNARVRAAEHAQAALREKDGQPILNTARRLLLATDDAERNAALGDLHNAIVARAALTGEGTAPPPPPVDIEPAEEFKTYPDGIVPS